MLKVMMDELNGSIFWLRDKVSADIKTEFDNEPVYNKNFWKYK